MKYKNILGLVILISFFGCQNEPVLSTKESGYVEINATKHYYEIIGTGDTIIILHGGPGLSHQYLKPQLDSLLSSHFTLLYYDQRGSGWSDGEHDTTMLNIETYVQDLEGIRKYFKLRKVNLLGHSFGGILGMYYAIEHVAHLNSLILVSRPINK